LVLQAGDTVDPRYIEVGLETLARQEQLAFVGSWRYVLSKKGRIIETFPFDAALELLPLSGTTLFSRFILRTVPGNLLIDLFDPRAGRLGELAYLWKLDDGEHCGILIPEPWITQASKDEDVLKSNAFDYLILQDKNPWRKQRLARYLLALQQRGAVLPVELAPAANLIWGRSAGRQWADWLRASPFSRWLSHYLAHSNWLTHWVRKMEQGGRFSRSLLAVLRRLRAVFR
jgi:hypothetical protein